MNKFLYGLMALALAGAVVSIIMLFQHYSPETSPAILQCGDGLTNPCNAVSTSPFGSLLGIPLAAWGLFSYLAIFFTLLVSDYAEELYLRFARTFTFIVVILSLAGDLFLGTMLIVMGQFCSFCVTTYLINGLIAGVTLFWFKADSLKPFSEVRSSLKDMLSLEKGSDRKAALASLLIAFFFLGFSVFSTSALLSKKNSPTIPEEEIASFLKDFYKASPENLTLPPTSLTLGPKDAKVTIIAFTDFLCSACYAFFKVEKHLLSVFPKDVRIVYYNYPLDSRCNKTMDHSIYPNSCIASRAMIAAQKNGIFKKYLVDHFKNYKRISHHYTEDISREILKNPSLEEKFNVSMSDSSTGLEILTHIESANRLQINATPTMFINGRKLVGVPPAKLMEALIREELRRQR
jgi:protein-disulfide isomerase/uncharacterized membrane protein